MKNILMKQKFVLAVLFGTLFLQGTVGVLADEWGYDYSFPSVSNYDYTTSNYDYTYPSVSNYDYTTSNYDYTSTGVSNYDYTTSNYDYTYPSVSNYDYTTSNYDYTYPTVSNYDYTYPTQTVDTGTWNTSSVDTGTWGTSYPVYGSTGYSDVYMVTGSSYPSVMVGVGGYGYTTYGTVTYGTYGVTTGTGNVSCPSGSTLINDTCQYPTRCPSGTTLINNTCQPNIQCPTGQTLVNNVCQPNTQCPTGTTLVNNICQPNTTTCPAGTTLINGVCQTNTTVCPAGTTLINGICQINTTTCPAGTTLINGTCQINTTVCPFGTVLINGVCQTQTVINPTYVCPNGTVVTYASQCPTIYTTPPITYQTCWNGSVIPNTAVCPAQYKMCANGTNIPVNQTCYFGGPSYPTVQPPQTVKYNNVVTSIVTEITNTSARCNGIGLIPNGVASTGWFEYGETPNLGRQTGEASIGRAVTAPFSNLLTNLKSNTAYYCRAVMKNQYGIVKGETVRFVTKTKTVSYVKPVTTPTKKTVVTTKKQEVTCTDGSTVWVKNESAAVLLNKGEKLIVLQIEKDDKVLAPGNAVSYKLAYKNLSDSRLNDVTFMVTLPEEIELSSATKGDYSEATRILTINAHSLDPYSEGTVTLSGKVKQNAEIGKSIVSTAGAFYTVPGTDLQDEVSVYVVGTIVPPSEDTSNVSTGAKKVIGMGGTQGFLPSSLVEWLALATIILIIFILGRSIYASYKDEEEMK